MIGLSISTPSVALLETFEMLALRLHLDNVFRQFMQNAIEQVSEGNFMRYLNGTLDPSLVRQTSPAIKEAVSSYLRQELDYTDAEENRHDTNRIILYLQEKARKR